ncbi:hypothetical protein ACOSQ3_023644 [Xanthoceras sorbifolium]
MQCFPYTLKDKAKQWLMTLPPSSLRTWSKVYNKFIEKLYSHQKTIELRSKVATFAQGDGEPLHEAWDRFKLLLIQCPHHGFPLEMHNQFFYNGLTLNYQAMVNNAVGGAMQKKTIKETYELFEMLGTNLQQKIGGHDCVVCPSSETFPEYVQEQAQTLNTFPLRQRNDPYSSNYNSGWRNYPNFFWRDNQQQPGQYQGYQ